MGTVNHKGNIYHIGQYYLFGDKPESHYFYGELKYVDASCESPFVAGHDNWKSCKDISSNNHGTITPPITLENGKAYQFDYCGHTHSGVYGSNMKRIYHINGFISASVCTNIQPLTVGVK
jgi:hypothetical protein